MTTEELKESMRYGSEREYDEEDLGKFGLGLKTASMSQCQRFSVASRKSSPQNEIPVLCWDLAHIEKTNKWEILHIKDKDTVTLITAPLSEHSGTVVLWEKLDRIINFKQPDGESARKKLIAMCRELEDYLAMVFHRFLSKEVPKKELEIYLNNNKIQPWDPFARVEPKASALSPTTIKLIHEGVTGKIMLQPYILPTKEDFSSPEAFEQLSGRDKWNQQQGFYIYRSNRMIQSGGWCGLRARDEHTKLSRISLDFYPILDSAFKINVAKMRVQLPISIRDDIERVIKPAVSLAREYYDKEKRTDSKGTLTPNIKTESSITLINNPRNSLIIPGTKRGTKDSSLKIFSFDEIEQGVIEISTPVEKRVISSVFSRLRKKIFGE